MICVTHIFKTREKHKAIKTKWRETGPVPKMFSSQCCSIARCSSTKSESSSTLLFRISSLPESLRWAFGIGTSALLVAGLPILPETKRGFKEALDPKRRETTVSPIWGWILGSFGFLGAYGGTNGYLTRIGKTNPVIAGFKTPFALFGAVLGGKLCNELSPILFDASGIISRLASYTVDGMIADTIGRPPNQPARWEEFSISNIISGQQGQREFNEVPEIRSPLASKASSAVSQTSVKTGAERCDQLVAESILRLVALRRQETVLNTARSYLGWSGDQAMLRAIQEEKRALKSEVQSQCCLQLSRHLHREVLRAADELTRMLLEQVALAIELGSRGLQGGGEELAREIRRLDAEKARIKHTARRELGANAQMSRE